MPLFGEIVAHGLVVSTHRREFDGGVGEVQVGMLQFIEHRLGRRCAVVQQMGGKGSGKGKLPTAVRSAEHHSMRQTAFLDHLHQPLLGFLLSDHLVKTHAPNLFTISTTESTADTV